MDDFARLPEADRRAFIEEAAIRRDVTPTIIEKDFWVCWTLRRLMTSTALKDQVTFKGGTSLSKAYGIIERFSEDIDLTIRRDAPFVREAPPAMEAGISGKERQRRIKALREGAQAYVASVAMPSLIDAIAEALAGTDGWTVELDPEDGDGQTLLFNYPRTLGPAQAARDSDGAAYIKPRIKLEYGARGEPEPFEGQVIKPYLAEEFPGELPDAETRVPTLSAARTYWEKVTLLHALHHKRTLRDGLSRHYYDLIMLDRAGLTTEALAKPELLTSVVRNKSLMFADKAASYETAVLGQLRIYPTGMIEALARDYTAMSEMFMSQPPTLDELLAAISDLEERLNGRAN